MCFQVFNSSSTFSTAASEDCVYQELFQALTQISAEEMPLQNVASRLTQLPIHFEIKQ